MPEFAFSEKDRDRWAARSGAAVAAAAARAREKMAARLSGRSTLPSDPSAVFRADDWLDELGGLEEEFGRIADEAATEFAKGTGLDESSAWSRVAAGALALAIAGKMAEGFESRGDVVESRVADLLGRGDEAGWEPVRLAQELGLDGDMPGPLSDALGEAMGASTSTAITEGAAHGVIDLTGAVGTKTWHCSFIRSRDTHMDMDTVEVDVDEVFVFPDGEAMYPGDWNLPIEESINCLAEGSTVTLPGLRYSTRRWYEGELVHLRFASGDKLAVTPNHPVLRSDGRWEAAQNFEVGDHALSGRFVGGLSGQPHVQGRPAEVGELHRALTLASNPERKRGAPPDFHGDGRHGDVQVVAANGLLRDHGNAATDEEVDQIGLTFADSARAGEGGLGHPVVVLGPDGREIGDVFAAGFVGGGGQRPALSAGQIGHPLGHGGGPPARLDPGAEETVADGFAADPEGPGDGQFALAVEVSTDEIVGVEIEAEWAGWVYNFDTGHGWYFTGNGIITRNCRCWLTYNVRLATGEDVVIEAGEAGVGFEPPEGVIAHAGHVHRSSGAASGVSADREALWRAVRPQRFDWDEDLHPRDERGRFGPGGGESKREEREGPKVVDLPPGTRSTQVWEAMLTPEAREKADPEKAHPERYEPNKGFGVHLRPGESELKSGTPPGVDPVGKPPSVYEIRALPEGVPISVLNDPDNEYGRPAGGMSRNYIVPGSERPVDAVYRVVSETDYQQILDTGVMRSDARQNLGDEGTVFSDRSTGEFYMPKATETSGHLAGETGRILRVDLLPGMVVDDDSYTKTKDPIPVSAIQAVSPPLGEWSHTFESGRVEPWGWAVVDPATGAPPPEDKLLPDPDAWASVRGRATFDWDEDLHPRDERGRFGPGGGGETQQQPQVNESTVEEAEKHAGKLWNEATVDTLAVYGREHPERLQPSVEEVQAEAARLLLEEARGPVVVHVPVGALNDVLTSGQFLSQHDTGRSVGTFDPGERDAREEKSFGRTDDGKVVHPIYGAIDRNVPDHPGAPLTGSGASGYGAVQFVFNDDVRDRTTVTFGDSLFHNAAPLPLGVENPDPERVFAAGASGTFRWGAKEAYSMRAIESLNVAAGNEPLGADEMNRMLHDPTDRPSGASTVARGAGMVEAAPYYTEAQIQGPLTLDDVAEVRFVSTGIPSEDPGPGRGDPDLRTWADVVARVEAAGLTIGGKATRESRNTDLLEDYGAPVEGPEADELDAILDRLRSGALVASIAFGVGGWEVWSNGSSFLASKPGDDTGVIVSLADGSKRRAPMVDLVKFGWWTEVPSSAIAASGATFDWDEDLHPRDERGRFGGGGGSTWSQPEVKPTAAASWGNLAERRDAVAPVARALCGMVGMADAVHVSGSKSGGVLGFERVDVTSKVRTELKVRGSTLVGQRMSQDDKFRAWVKERSGQSLGGLSPQAEGQRLARAYTSSWAANAADSDTQALALQMSAAEVFGLSTEALEDRANADYDQYDVIGAAEERYAAEGPAMDAFWRAAYEQTQADLDDLGLVDADGNVQLFRGWTDMAEVPGGEELLDFVYERSEEAWQPEWNKDNPSDLAARMGVAASVAANPLSSWSFDPVTAVRGFTEPENSLIATAMVPRENIVAIPSTGPGCLSEFEAIVAGFGEPGAEATFVSPSAVRADLSRLTPVSETFAVVAPPRAPFYIDYPGLGGEDWPKRTPDTAEALGLPAPEAFAVATFDWDESLHPRDERGRFGPGDGGSKDDTDEPAKDAQEPTKDAHVGPGGAYESERTANTDFRKTPVTTEAAREALSKIGVGASVPGGLKVYGWEALSPERAQGIIDGYTRMARVIPNVVADVGVVATGPDEGAWTGVLSTQPEFLGGVIYDNPTGHDPDGEYGRPLGPGMGPYAIVQVFSPEIGTAELYHDHYSPLSTYPAADTRMAYEATTVHEMGHAAAQRAICAAGAAGRYDVFIGSGMAGYHGDRGLPDERMQFDYDDAIVHAGAVAERAGLDPANLRMKELEELGPDASRPSVYGLSAPGEFVAETFVSHIYAGEVDGAHRKGWIKDSLIDVNKAIPVDYMEYG